MRIIVEDVDMEIFIRFKEWADNGGIPLGKAITMAIDMFLHEKEQERITERIRERMSKGLYKLPKDWKFNRDEACDRK